MRWVKTAFCLGAAVFTACGDPALPEWHGEDGYRWRELVVPTRGRSGFEAVAGRRSGVGFSNSPERAAALLNRHLTHGSGVALGDMDGDGLVDIFFARLDGPNVLYRNLGGWRFEDVTLHAGVGAPDRRSTGAVLADVDGDRDLDLLLSALGSANSVFINDGTGVFAERILGSAQDSTGSTTMTLADVDGDGDLDLYVTNYKARSALDIYPPEERTFDRIVREDDGRFRITPGMEKDFRVFERPDLGAVGYVQRAEPDAFYINDGEGDFTRVSFTSGRFVDSEGEALTEEPDFFGMTARFHDVNGDGAPDLFVANDFEDPDHFWLNDGAGGFRAAPDLSLRATSNAGMAIDFSDIDRDGDVDFFEVDMLSMDRAVRMRQVPTHTDLPKVIGAIANRPQMMRNTLFLNRGDESFAQIAEFADVRASGWSWGTMFLDVDLDGYEDILVTTGHAWDIMDADTQRRLGTLDYDWREEFLLFPGLNSPNRAFRNRGDLTFEEVGSRWGFGVDPDISHGIASADLDQDGDIDIVVTRLDAPPLLLRNETSAPRVSVRLIGALPNSGGIGTVVRLERDGALLQQKEVTSGGMYLSGSDGGLTFALDTDATASLEVRWRDGTRSHVEAVRANRLYEIRQTEGPATVTLTGIVPATVAPPPYFEDVSALIGHQHTETDYDERARQSLLPNELSRFGPGVSWYDVDGDGREDLLVPSGRGGALAHFRNLAVGFRRVGASSVRTEGDQTTALPVPDGRGGTQVLLGQSSYEAESPAQALRLPSVVAAGPRGTPLEVLPGDTSSVGQLASADVDGDGDLDVFVGARVVPAAYPIGGSSRIYLNEGDAYVRDGLNTSILGSLGMVSAATFSDVDGDGDPDLLAAIEWGPLVLLLNEGGRFVRAGDEWGLGVSGRWNGVTTGDFDGDGRLDIVATNWGRNTAFRPEAARPLILYFGDLDRNGSLDLIQAQRDTALDQLVPLDGFSRLAAGIPSLAQRVPSISAFAGATLQDLFGPSLAAAGRYEAETYDHMLYLNRGGRFEGVPLPSEAQFAPAFYAGVADFDGDGNEDLFITQNFFPTARGSSRLDAGRSLWMRGDGLGGLVSVSGQRSGVQVWGDARGAGLADFNGDGRVDLAVAQNGAATRLFENVGGVPGLRVRLSGTGPNPVAIGAVMRLVYEDHRGPAREVRLGSGYWSVDGPLQVLGGIQGAIGVHVRWPDGSESVTEISPGAGEVTISQPGAGR